MKETPVRLLPTAPRAEMRKLQIQPHRVYQSRQNQHLPRFRQTRFYRIASRARFLPVEAQGFRANPSNRPIPPCSAAPFLPFYRPRLGFSIFHPAFSVLCYLLFNIYEISPMFRVKASKRSAATANAATADLYWVLGFIGKRDELRASSRRPNRLLT